MGLFFNLVTGRLQDLHLHRLATQGALQLLDPLFGGLELRYRDHLLVGLNGHRATTVNALLPTVQKRLIHPQLPAQLRDRALPAHDTAHCLLLKLGGKQPSAVRPCSMPFHVSTSLRISKNISSETVSLNWGAEQKEEKAGYIQVAEIKGIVHQMYREWKRNEVIATIGDFLAQVTVTV